MAIVYLGLGSNLGDREGFLARARDEIGRYGACLAVSLVYETEPVGFLDQPAFLNQVMELETSLKPLDLLREMQLIEDRLGRERTVRWGPRTIDIDILLYDDLVLDSASLIVPHPRMVERRFVLEPLNEIASWVVHPVLGKTIGELFAALRD